MTDTPLQRGLIGPIISRFENRGFKLAAIKLVTPTKEHLEKHYEDLSDKPFFPGLIACTPCPPPLPPTPTPPPSC
jgi:nucleoside diphosphate kinase